ncbi:unnamed protein product [Lepeophtheirus salmonis]|uniref:(salmon louse) hypothetical protein n=1 Tax=Lepeophtheirus salmonis TaxID=72036 RepID=A0A7R8CB46_LEPSM|nr:unnamed protein product [Lepeophtheirus salmonis]CAF2755937.1 unnamed protein product [Lepeophtheirus salmonis]
MGGSIQHQALLAVFYCILLRLSHGCSSKGGTYGDYRVIKKSDSNGNKIVVALGEDTKLSCQTNAPWKNCIWKPPRNGVRDSTEKFHEGPWKCEFELDLPNVGQM